MKRDQDAVMPDAHPARSSGCEAAPVNGEEPQDEKKDDDGLKSPACPMHEGRPEPLGPHRTVLGRFRLPKYPTS